VIYFYYSERVGLQECLIVDYQFQVDDVANNSPPLQQLTYPQVVLLPDPFRGMGAWRNSTENQQSGHAPRYGPEVKNGRSGAEDGALKGSDAGQSRRR